MAPYGDRVNDICRYCEEPIRRRSEGATWFHDVVPHSFSLRLDYDHHPVSDYVIEEEP